MCPNARPLGFRAAGTRQDVVGPYHLFRLYSWCGPPNKERGQGECGEQDDDNGEAFGRVHQGRAVVDDDACDHNRHAQAEVGHDGDG